MPTGDTPDTRQAIVDLVAEVLEFFAYADAISDVDEDSSFQELAEHIVGVLESAGYL